MALAQLNFESQYLVNNNTVSIILPDKPRFEEAEEFYNSGKKYKVLWLLHGTFGDHSDWIRKSRIDLYASERELMVVMPSGLNANYSNWPKFSMGFDMYSFLLKELMSLIYNWFPASSEPEDNFIAGQGGGLIYALNHPEKFAGVASFSAPPMDMEHMDRSLPIWPREQGKIDNAGGMEAFLNSVENTWGLASKRAGSKNLPKFYFSCGKADKIFFPLYLHFKEYAEETGFPAIFEEYEGYEHEWRLWDLCLERALDVFGIEKVETKEAPMDFFVK